MKTKLTILLVLLTCNLFAQVKEHEIVSKNKADQPNLIKFKETKILEVFNKRIFDIFVLLKLC